MQTSRQFAGCMGKPKVHINCGNLYFVINLLVHLGARLPGPENPLTRVNAAWTLWKKNTEPLCSTFRYYFGTTEFWLCLVVQSSRYRIFGVVSILSCNRTSLKQRWHGKKSPPACKTTCWIIFRMIKQWSCRFRKIYLPEPETNGFSIYPHYIWTEKTQKKLH